MENTNTAAVAAPISQAMPLRVPAKPGKKPAKPTVTVEFDGCVLDCDDAWHLREITVAETVIRGEAAEGIKEALEKLARGNTVHIVSPRAASEMGRRAIELFMNARGLPYDKIVSCPRADMRISHKAVFYDGSWRDTVKYTDGFQTYLEDEEGARRRHDLHKKIEDLETRIEIITQHADAVYSELLRKKDRNIHRMELMQEALRDISQQIVNKCEMLKSLGEVGRDSGEEKRLLTQKQLEIMKLLAEGKQNKLIARELKLAPATVSQHLNVIYKVLKVEGRKQAVVKALELGLI